MCSYFFTVQNVKLNAHIQSQNLAKTDVIIMRTVHINTAGNHIVHVCTSEWFLDIPVAFHILVGLTRDMSLQ